jgi:hypothetical protein
MRTRLTLRCGPILRARLALHSRLALHARLALHSRLALSSGLALHSWLALHARLTGHAARLTLHSARAAAAARTEATTRTERRNTSLTRHHARSETLPAWPETLPGSPETRPAGLLAARSGPWPAGPERGYARVRHCRQQQRERELVPFLLQVRDLVPGDDDLEHAAVDLPVAELPGAALVHAEIDDVQPVAQVVEHQAGFAAVVADRAGFPERVDVVQLHMLAPETAGNGGEAVLLGRRRSGEQRDIPVGRAHGSLVRGA